MKEMIETLKHPEYVHVLLNPLPVYALSMGILAMLLAFFLRSKQAQIVGLTIVVLSCASAWPVVYFGREAEHHLQDSLNEESKAWLEQHMKRGETGAYGFYATALLGIAALAARAKFVRTKNTLVALTLAGALVSFGLAGWISHAGGQVRHSEFRQGPAPQAEQGKEKGGHQH